MSIFVFIVLIAIGASFLASGLVILAVITASRSTARLAEKYPEIYSEDAAIKAQRSAEALPNNKNAEALPNNKQEELPTATQTAAH